MSKHSEAFSSPYSGILFLSLAEIRFNSQTSFRPLSRGVFFIADSVQVLWKDAWFSSPWSGFIFMTKKYVEVCIMTTVFVPLSGDSLFMRKGEMYHDKRSIVFVPFSGDSFFIFLMMTLTKNGKSFRPLFGNSFFIAMFKAFMQAFSSPIRGFFFYCC